MSTAKMYEMALKELFKRVGLRYPNKKFTAQDRWYNKRAWLQSEYDDYRDWLIKLLMKRMRMLKKKDNNCMKKIMRFIDNKIEQKNKKKELSI